MDKAISKIFVAFEVKKKGSLCNFSLSPGLLKTYCSAFRNWQIISSSSDMVTKTV